MTRLDLSKLRDAVIAVAMPALAFARTLPSAPPASSTAHLLRCLLATLLCLLTPPEQSLGARLRAIARTAQV